MLPDVKKLRAPMLLALVMLASGCASNSPPPVLQPAAIPPLPQAARQPKPPPICSQTCNAGLTKLRMKLLDMLTPPAMPASPANAPPTR